ncbi:MAG: hypothetical protein GTN89_04515, partial [Acidobacteria bacterium]|nr:hypothetical protein [Acidobacteriota bacterium]NIQ29635.1 hypothetical protein [Acidobacteriota bacterium]NIQ84352.1 hypothetical protein [Acidobacteriota bacterium]NIT10301.1 hypothetical protein [Acidobacteriota bacterium]
AVAAPLTGSRMLPWALVALLVLVAAFALWRAASTPPAGERELITLVAPVTGLAGVDLPGPQEGVMALSPDGKAIALVLPKGGGTSVMYVRRLDRDELIELPGTKGALTPFFSPDGKWIGFFADNALKKVPTTGGTPLTLCDAQGSNRGATWGADDVITFAPHYTRPLMRVPAAGGDPVEFTTIDAGKGERTHRWPHAVHGEDLVLFTVGTIDSPENYDDARIEAIRPTTGERIPVLERASMAWYTATGHLVFGRDGFLFAVPFDVDRVEVLGNPVPVVEDVQGVRGSGVVRAGIARNGLLAYFSGSGHSRQSRLIWRDRDGSIEPLPAPVNDYEDLAISPDRKQIAVSVRDAPSVDIWTYRLEQETLTRLTFEGQNIAPTWSPDGRRIAFGSARGNELIAAFVKAADGSGPAEMLVSAPELDLPDAGTVIPRGWTSDERQLLVQYADENMQNIGLVSEDAKTLTVVAASPATEIVPVLSPNGRWLAYASDETGQIQVYVRAFPGPGGKWQVSTTGGSRPRWAPDGNELFYKLQTNLYVVNIEDDDGSFRSGRPELVFDDLPLGLGFDVFDSNRLLLVEPVGTEADFPGVTVVVNWLDELQRLVPVE